MQPLTGCRTHGLDTDTRKRERDDTEDVNATTGKRSNTSDKPAKNKGCAKFHIKFDTRAFQYERTDKEFTSNNENATFFAKLAKRANLEKHWQAAMAAVECGLDLAETPSVTREELCSIKAQVQFYLRYNQQAAKTPAELSAALVQSVQESCVLQTAPQPNVEAEAPKPLVKKEGGAQDPATNVGRDPVVSSSGITKDPKVYLKSAKFLRQDGRMENAQNILENGLQECVSMSTNERADLLLELTSVRRQQKKWREAEEAAKATLALLPDLSLQVQAMLYIELTIIRRERGNFEEAAAAAKAGLALKSSNGIKFCFYTELVNIQEQRGLLDEAVKAAQAALELKLLKKGHPDEDKYKQRRIAQYTKLAELELRRGNWAEAAFAARESLKLHAPSQNSAETDKRKSFGIEFYTQIAKSNVQNYHLILAASLTPQQQTRHLKRILTNCQRPLHTGEKIRDFAEEFRSASKANIACIALEQTGHDFNSSQSPDQASLTIAPDEKVGTLYAIYAEATFQQHHFVEAAVSAQVALHFLQPGSQMAAWMAAQIQKAEKIQTNLAYADAERATGFASSNPDRNCEMQAVFYLDLAEDQLLYHHRYDGRANNEHPNSLHNVAITVLETLKFPSKTVSNQTMGELYALLTKVKIKQNDWNGVKLAAETGLKLKDPLPSGPIQTVLYAALAEAKRELAMNDLHSKQDLIAAVGFREAVDEAQKGLEINNLPRNEQLRLYNEISSSVIELKKHFIKVQDQENFALYNAIGKRAEEACDELMGRKLAYVKKGF